jgi:hypothetical protein
VPAWTSRPRLPLRSPPHRQVTFIGSPKHIRSPYLRSKLSEVLHAWLPQGEVNPGFRRGWVHPRGGGGGVGVGGGA